MAAGWAGGSDHPRGLAQGAVLSVALGDSDRPRYPGGSVDDPEVMGQCGRGDVLLFPGTGMPIGYLHRRDGEKVARKHPEIRDLCLLVR